MPFIGRGGSSPPSDTYGGAFARRHRFRDRTSTPVPGVPPGQPPAGPRANALVDSGPVCPHCGVAGGTGGIPLDVALFTDLVRVLAALMAAASGARGGAADGSSITGTGSIGLVAGGGEHDAG